MLAYQRLAVAACRGPIPLALPRATEFHGMAISRNAEVRTVHGRVTRSTRSIKNSLLGAKDSRDVVARESKHWP